MKQVSRLFLGLTFLYTLLICALGSWWLYLIIQYGGKLETLLGNEDKGKVIGRQGRVAQSMRLLLRIAAVKDGSHAILEIV